MAKLRLELSMSLDGFTAGPDQSVENPLGVGDGTRLFENLAGEHIELEPTRVVEAPGVVHLMYRVMGG